MTHNTGRGVDTTRTIRTFSYSHPSFCHRYPSFTPSPELVIAACLPRSLPEWKKRRRETKRDGRAASVGESRRYIDPAVPERRRPWTSQRDTQSASPPPLPAGASSCRLLRLVIPSYLLGSILPLVLSLFSIVIDDRSCRRDRGDACIYSAVITVKRANFVREDTWCTYLHRSNINNI